MERESQTNKNRASFSQSSEKKLQITPTIWMNSNKFLLESLLRNEETLACTLNKDMNSPGRKFKAKNIYKNFHSVVELSEARYLFV